MPALVEPGRVRVTTLPEVATTKLATPTPAAVRIWALTVLPVRSKATPPSVRMSWMGRSSPWYSHRSTRSGCDRATDMSLHTFAQPRLENPEAPHRLGRVVEAPHRHRGRRQGRDGNACLSPSPPPSIPDGASSGR